MSQNDTVGYMARAFDNRGITWEEWAPTVAIAIARADRSAYNGARVSVQGPYTSDGSFHRNFGGRTEAYREHGRWLVYTYSAAEDAIVKRARQEHRRGAFTKKRLPVLKNNPVSRLSAIIRFYEATGYTGVGKSKLAASLARAGLVRPVGGGEYEITREGLRLLEKDERLSSFALKLNPAQMSMGHALGMAAGAGALLAFVLSLFKKKP